MTLCAYCQKIDLLEIIRPSAWLSENDESRKKRWRRISDCTEHHASLNDLVDCAFDRNGCQLCKLFLSDWSQSSRCYDGSFSKDEVRLPGEDDISCFRRLITRREKRISKFGKTPGALYIGPSHSHLDVNTHQAAGVGLWESRDDTDALGDNSGKLIGTLEFFFMRDALPKNDHILTSFIWNRGIQEDPKSPSCLRLANEWLQDCLQNHEICKSALGPDKPLPTRVIHVGNDLEEPRLVITNARPGRYVALSYCWGQDCSKHVKLFRENISSFQNQIALSSLPLSLQNAVFVTRQIGMSYLWIDALCIVQDDPDDWRREAARMMDVYSNATITLLAVNSPSAIDGFLGKREVKPHCGLALRLPYSRASQAEQMKTLRDHHGIVRGSDSQGLGTPGLEMSTAQASIDDEFESAEIFTSLKQDSDHEDEFVSNGPWRSRGWTLQEYISSSRKISYTKKQMSWQCPTCIVRESGERIDLIPKQRKSIEEGLSGSRHSGRLTEISNHWSALTQVKEILFKELPEEQHQDLLIDEFYMATNEYWHRSFTYQSDKLAATAGLARTVEKKLLGKDRYYAGIWESNWILGLQWEVIGNDHPDHDSPTPNGKRNVPNAPSWSWASVISSLYRPWPSRRTKRYGAPQSCIKEIKAPKVTSDQDRFIPRGPLVLQFTAPYLRLPEAWTKADTSASTLWSFELELKRAFRIDAPRPDLNSKSEHGQKHQPYLGQHFAIVQIFKWIQHGLKDEPFETFFLIVESVKEYPGWYRCIELMKLKEPDIPETFRSIPWIEREIHLV